MCLPGVRRTTRAKSLRIFRLQETIEEHRELPVNLHCDRGEEEIEVQISVFLNKIATPEM